MTMIIYIVKANSETCKNGFQAGPLATRAPCGSSVLTPLSSHPWAQAYSGKKQVPSRSALRIEFGQKLEGRLEPSIGWNCPLISMRAVLTNDKFQKNPLTSCGGA